MIDELARWSVLGILAGSWLLTSYFLSQMVQRLLGLQVRVVFIYAQVDVFGTEQVYQLEDCFPPCARGQVALLLVQRGGDEDGLIEGVRAARPVGLEGPLAQLVVVRRAHGVAGEEDAHDQHEEDEEVRDGEDGPVDEAEDGSLAAARCNVVCVDGAVEEVGYAQCRGRPRDPPCRRGAQLGVVLGLLIERITRQELVGVGGMAVFGRHGMDGWVECNRARAFVRGSDAPYRQEMAFSHGME